MYVCMYLKYAYAMTDSTYSDCIVCYCDYLCETFRQIRIRVRTCVGRKRLLCIQIDAGLTAH